MGIINHKLKKYGSQVPGPGAYEPKPAIKETSLSYSMGAITVDKNKIAEKHSRSPGPGNYDPNNKFESTNKFRGNTKFGTS